jgi:SAM-dependent methyltransferase
VSPAPLARPHGGSPSLDHPDYWWYRARAELLRVALQRWVGTPQLVLDVGSADGPSVGWLDGVATKVALDVDPRGLRPPWGVCGSLLALPFRSDCFEVVTAFDVVEHCDPEDQAVAELARVLAPGGRLLVSVPAYQWAWSDHDVQNGHHRRYTRGRAVAALERQGLVVERATYGFTAVFPFFAAERLARRALRSLRSSRGAKQDPGGPADVVAVPEVSPATERLLLGLTRLDERLLRRRDLPFGSSVFLAAVKP